MTWNVLLTGGTGFIGKAMIARLVDSAAYDRIYLLVRPKGRETPEARIAQIIEGMFPQVRHAALRERILAVPGDLTAPCCDVSEATRTLLAADVHQILHVGASTDFGEALEKSRRTNVEGTRHVLDLALRLKETGRLQRFDYVSTAYVAGRKAGRVREQDLERGQDFSNNYEQSKYEAEQLVRTYAGRLAVAIYRPSIVVGDSVSGYTPHFKVLYWPMLVLKKNLMPFYAVNRRARLDVVPIDYVANSLVALMQRSESVGETFHLTVGHGRELRVGRFLRDVYRFTGITRRPNIPYWLFKAIERSPLRRLFAERLWRAWKLAQPYFFYLRGTGVRFDSARTEATLRALGVTPPRWDDYKREILTFCPASDWGKKLPHPEYVYYLPSWPGSQATP